VRQGKVLSKKHISKRRNLTSALHTLRTLQTQKSFALKTQTLRPPFEGRSSFRRAINQGSSLELFVRQCISFMQQNYKKYFGIQKRVFIF
jgi:uncharacterized protein (DUF1800 family)